MPSPIDGYLATILSAIYGEQVRSAIHDSIARCYSDVQGGVTIAEGAASSATNATTTALTAANTALAAASSATVAASNATAIVASASAATSSANSAASRAETAASSCTALLSDISAATSEAYSAAGSARTATTNANTATSNANSAATFAISAGSAASAAAIAANQATSDATAAISACNTARLNADTATAAASTATGRANSAASAIEGLTVTSEDVDAATSASASVTDVNGHKNIHFYLRQGKPGATVIKGHAYASLEALNSDVPVGNREIGDLYNIGTTAPYDVYRWTGDSWENQGSIGITFENLTTAEIDTLWNGTAIQSSTSKYINHTGLLHLFVNKIKAGLTSLSDGKVDKVTGKGLSTNDFTTEYKDAVDTNSAAITSLSSNKVDKVTGKGLSTNDFTDTYKDKITNNETDIATLTGAVGDLGEYEPLHIEFSYSTDNREYQSELITEDMRVIECEFRYPNYITSTTSWTTANGSITLSGTVTNPTTVYLTLVKCNTVEE